MTLEKKSRIIGAFVVFKISSFCFYSLLTGSLIAR